MIGRCVILAFAVLLTGAIAASALLLPLRAHAADETIKCAVCGKQVKKDKAIRVIQDGRTYYVCSEECLAKLKKKKKK
jgi:YHS domain-containing protein